MKYTRTDNTATEVSFDVTLPYADLAEIKKLTLTKLSQDLKVPGFRPGKAPLNMAEKHLDANLFLSQLTEDVVNKSIIEILNTEKLQALDQPQVEIKSFDPKKELNYSAKIEILPKITLGNYKKLKLNKTLVSITKKDVDEVLERIREGQAVKTAVKRTAKNGDEVVIDFDGFDAKNQPVSGASGKDFQLRLGSKTFIPGFEDGIVGKKSGDKFELNLTFPKNYHATELANKKVNFKINLKTVNQIDLPKIDDALAKKVGDFKTLAELEADIKRELANQRQIQADNQQKDSLLEQLVSKSNVPVPNILLQDQIKALERDAVNNLAYQGLTLDQYLAQQKLTHDSWHDKELQPAAERRVQVGLVLAELTKLENITISADELEAALQERKKQAPQMAAQLDTPEARRDLANRELTEKTLQKLIQLNS